jgi:hypothetical protein
MKKDRKRILYRFFRLHRLGLKGSETLARMSYLEPIF